MKIKITLLLIECNTKTSRTSSSSVRLLLDDRDNIPSISAYKSVEDSLTKLCHRHLSLDYKWLVKELADFRICNINGEIVGEAVYIINTPPIDGAVCSGKLLSLEEIYSRNIGVDEFYERILIGSGRNLFR